MSEDLSAVEREELRYLRFYHSQASEEIEFFYGRDDFINQDWIEEGNIVPVRYDTAQK